MAADGLKLGKNRKGAGSFPRDYLLPAQVCMLIFLNDEAFDVLLDPSADTYTIDVTVKP